MIDDDKPSLEELVHFGVKGMRWGIRNDEPGGLRLQGAAPVIDQTLPQSTKIAGKKVAALIDQRYGLHISAINSIPPTSPEYHMGTIGYVESTPGKRGGVIYAKPTDVRAELKGAEDIGWFAEGCGTPQAFLTHESAHAIFHAEQKVRNGLVGPKTVGGNIKARDKALKAAIKEAKREGVPRNQFSSKVSGYAAASGMREEVEAELFSQYHWGSNPPQFVKTWGQTLHQEMGIDSTPFKEDR